MHTTAPPTHVLMRRPHLADLPDAPPLPDGYALRAFAGAADVAPLADTLTRAFGDAWDAERVRAKLTEAPDVKAVYLVDWRGAPVATASSRLLPERFPNTGYVHWVGTHPDHARRGLSSALMLRVLRDFADRGYDGAVLETDDFRIPAIRTYLKYGFIPDYDVSGEDHRARWAAIFGRIFGD